MIASHLYWCPPALCDTHTVSRGSTDQWAELLVSAARMPRTVFSDFQIGHRKYRIICQNGDGRCVGGARCFRSLIKECGGLSN